MLTYHKNQKLVSQTSYLAELESSVGESSELDFLNSIGTLQSPDSAEENVCILENPTRLDQHDAGQSGGKFLSLRLDTEEHHRVLLLRRQHEILAQGVLGDLPGRGLHCDCLQYGPGFHAEDSNDISCNQNIPSKS